MTNKEKVIINSLRKILKAKADERDSTKSLLYNGGLPEEYGRADGMMFAFNEVLEIIDELESANDPSKLAEEMEMETRFLELGGAYSIVNANCRHYILDGKTYQELPVDVIKAKLARRVA